MEHSNLAMDSFPNNSLLIFPIRPWIDQTTLPQIAPPVGKIRRLNLPETRTQKQHRELHSIRSDYTVPPPAQCYQFQKLPDRHTGNQHQLPPRSIPNSAGRVCWATKCTAAFSTTAKLRPSCRSSRQRFLSARASAWCAIGTRPSPPAKSPRLGHLRLKTP